MHLCFEHEGQVPVSAVSAWSHFAVPWSWVHTAGWTSPQAPVSGTRGTCRRQKFGALATHCHMHSMQACNAGNGPPMHCQELPGRAQGCSAQYLLQASLPSCYAGMRPARRTAPRAWQLHMPELTAATWQPYWAPHQLTAVTGVPRWRPCSTHASTIRRTCAPRRRARAVPHHTESASSRASRGLCCALPVPASSATK